MKCFKLQNKDNLIKPVVIDQELYDRYVSNGYVIVYARGYAPHLNPVPERDKNGKYFVPPEKTANYSDAKKAYETNWTQLPTKTFTECVEHMSRGGWIGVILPDNVLALDIDGKDKDPAGYEKKIADFNTVLEKHKIKDQVGIHTTNNGIHAIFKVSVGFSDITTGSYISDCGIPITYRPGRGNHRAQLVISPCNNRSWQHFVPTAELAEMPDEFKPSKENTFIREAKAKATSVETSAPTTTINKKKILDIGRALGQSVRAAYDAGQIGGHLDIELAFFTWLAIDCGNDLELIENIFEPIQDGQGTNKRIADFKRLHALKHNGKNIIGGGTWFHILKVNALDELANECRKYEKLFPKIPAGLLNEEQLSLKIAGHNNDLEELAKDGHKNEKLCPKIPVGLLTEDQLSLKIVGHNNDLDVLIWHEGRIKTLSTSDLNREKYLLLTGIDPKTNDHGEKQQDFWQHYKKSILSIAHEKGQIDNNEKIKDGVWKFGKNFFIVSGLDVLKINSDGSIEEMLTPVISKSDAGGNNILLSLSRRYAWFDVGHFMRTFTPQLNGAALLKSCFDRLYRIVNQWHWKDPHMAAYVTAAIMLTPLQHGMKWRPLLYLGGERDSGKTYLHDNVPPALYGALVKRLDQTTKFAVAQTFGNTGKYMILDEFEKYKRIPQILDLLKNCGFGGTYVSGTTGEDSLEYKVHHMAWLSSTQPHTFDAAQASRVVRFELTKPEGRTPPVIPSDTDMRKLGVEIIAALIKVWPQLDAQYDYYHTNARSFDCDNRMVHNAAYMTAVINLASGSDMTSVKFPQFFTVQIREDRDAILDHILGGHIRVNSGDRLEDKSVESVLTEANDIEQGKIGSKYGIRIYTDKRKETWLAINPELVQRHILKDMAEYKDGIFNIEHSLMRIPGTKKEKIRIAPGRKGLQRVCVLIPINSTPFDLEDLSPAVCPDRSPLQLPISAPRTREHDEHT